jgi:alanine racemase
MKTWINVSRRALRSNYQVLKTAVAPAQVFAVVKSDAYGHGLKLVAEALKDLADGFAVDRVEEGILLRECGVEAPILVLGYTEPARLEYAIERGLELTIASFEQLQQLRFTTQEKKSPVTLHLEAETGLYRQGIPEEELRLVAECLQEMPWVTVKGLYTHFANVEEDETGAYPREQLARFDQVQSTLRSLGIVPPLRHTACSAAALGLPSSRFEAVRAGIALYGVWSSELTKRQAQGLGLPADALQPVLIWKTIVAQVKLVRKGETIGYARGALVEQDTRIAILPIGYYDGYTRLLSSKGVVLVNGVRCPVIGRICMNMCMVDVSAVATPIPLGTEVTLIGPGMEVEEVYTQAGTIHHDILARLSSSIPRQLVD